jgi:hypothetical protein
MDDPTLHIYISHCIVDSSRRSFIETDRRMVRTDRHKLMLDVPNVPDRTWDYDITDLDSIDDGERQEFAESQEINEVIVLSPDQAAFENETGVDMDTVPLEIGVAVQATEYRRSADHLKTVVGWAWQRLKRGRTVKRVFWDKEWVLFLFSLDPEKINEASKGADLMLMEDALREAGVGKVISDNYELKRLREMVEKFGGPVPV